MATNRQKKRQKRAHNNYQTSSICILCYLRFPEHVSNPVAWWLWSLVLFCSASISFNRCPCRTCPKLPGAMMSVCFPSLRFPFRSPVLSFSPSFVFLRSVCVCVCVRPINSESYRTRALPASMSDGAGHVPSPAGECVAKKADASFSSFCLGRRHQRMSSS